MSTGHNAILMNMSDNRILMITVVDRETLPLNVSIGLAAVNTTSSIYSNGLPQMTIRMDEVRDYSKELEGQGVAGILRSPIWAIKKYKSVTDMLGM